MELEAADRYCRYLANRHYENFSVTSLALSPPIRLHLARIYAFCRTTDDLGDESGDAALERLEDWRRQVEACLERREAPVHPVLIALSRTISECSLSARPFLDLIRANVQDQTVTSYENWDDVLGYCRYSAAPVGRMVLGVFGIAGHAAEQLSDSVCIGLQLANFAQDVQIDREKGRTYLVQEDIRSSGVRGATRIMCDRAEGLLDAGIDLEAMAPWPLRVQLALYRLGGLAIISEIRRINYETDTRRPRVSRQTKVRLVSIAAREALWRKQRVTAHGPA